MKLFTIGYGGRTGDEFLSMLDRVQVRTIVDVRLRPDRASMGIWQRAKSPDKGIERLLNQVGIAYHSLIELGNIFLDFEDWRERYQQLLDGSGDLILKRLDGIAAPYALLCAEKRVGECHREMIARYLAETRGFDIVHLE